MYSVCESLKLPPKQLWIRKIHFRLSANFNQSRGSENNIIMLKDIKYKLQKKRKGIKAKNVIR